ncbi:MAG: prealbumin-like fold domain-containing protein [Gaiellaceae bacterium]
MKVIPFLVIAALLAGCGGSPGASDSGIRGRAVVGPTCPVEQVGVPCPPEPFQGTFNVNQNGSLVQTVTTDADGRFSVSLEPGDYTLDSVQSDSGLPLLAPVEVTVRPHAFTRVTLSFDSGIR